jgi:hypothetical protein
MLREFDATVIFKFCETYRSMRTGALNEAMDQWWHQPNVKK